MEIRRVWHPRRVSADALDMIEHRLRLMIDLTITGHPTRGVTFTEANR